MSLSIGLAYDLRADYLADGHSEESVAEFDSEETVAALESTIAGLGYKTDRIGNAKALCKRLVSGDRWDLVFNIAEGLSGRCRESQVPCILDLYGIGYTFSDPLVCAATLDKGLAKRLVRAFALPTPKFKVIRDAADLRHLALEYPLFVKPAAEGTGKGIDARSRVESPQELAAVCEDRLTRFAQPVLVEEFLPGREFTVGVLGNGEDALVLGTMEVEVVDHSTNGIYSLDAKERCEEKVRYTALRSGQLRKRLEDLALKTYRVLECRDAARLDFRLDRLGEPSFMEVNPLPGLHPTHSDLPMIARQEGMSYSKLIESIVNSALSRLGVSPCVVSQKS